MGVSLRLLIIGPRATAGDFLGEVNRAIVPDVIEFYGLPEGTNLADWVDLPEVAARDASLVGLRRR